MLHLGEDGLFYLREMTLSCQKTSANCTHKNHQQLEMHNSQGLEGYISCIDKVNR